VQVSLRRAEHEEVLLGAGTTVELELALTSEWASTEVRGTLGWPRIWANPSLL
jgi:hypothetical protein